MLYNFRLGMIRGFAKLLGIRIRLPHTQKDFAENHQRALKKLENYYKNKN